MRDELFRYRKRKNISLDGSLPGIPQNNFTASRRHVSGMPHRSGSPGYHHSQYIPDSPREYRPSLNAPSIDWDEYNTNEQAGMHHVPARNNIQTYPPLPDIDERQIPGLLSVPQDDMTLEERFLLAMGKRNDRETIPFEHQPRININGHNLDEAAAIDAHLPDEAFDFDNHALCDADSVIHDETEEKPAWLIDDGPAMLSTLTPEDTMHRFIDITDALGQLQKVLPPEHSDIINLRSAMHDILNDPDAMSKLESLAGDIVPTRFSGMNPYENDDIIPQVNGIQEQFFEASQLEQNILSQSGAIEQREVFADDFTASGLEQIIEDEQAVFSPEPFFAAEPLMPIPEMEMPFEQNIFHENSAFDEINQAIDQITEQPMLQETQPDPFQMQYDPFMERQYMFNPQYRPDYMMPGFDPMNPGFGPMGPMPFAPM
jgi:hypothetical protein